MTREEAIDLLLESKDSDLRMSIREWEEWDKRFFEAIDMAIEALERKRGEWSLNIDDWFGDCYKCSACGEEFVLNDGTPKDYGYNYCPNCGSEMKEGKEDE